MLKQSKRHPREDTNKNVNADSAVSKSKLRKNKIKSLRFDV